MGICRISQTWTFAKNALTRMRIARRRYRRREDGRAFGPLREATCRPCGRYGRRSMSDRGDECVNEDMGLPAFFERPQADAHEVWFFVGRMGSVERTTRLSDSYSQA